VICVFLFFVNTGRSGFPSALILAMSFEFAYLGVAAFQTRGMMPTNVQVITQRRVGGHTIILLSN
jgi:hypothetical protein